MWTTEVHSVSSGIRIGLVAEAKSAPVSYRQAMSLLMHDRAFRTFVNSVLADASYRAFRWETPPVNLELYERPFEFVLLDAPSLTRPADFAAFKAQFASAPEASVLAFENLGKDAMMIAPAPLGSAPAYVHLAAFVREAPSEQRDALWRLVGETMSARVGKSPLWLSTAGAGVPRLHVRLDSTPKYYGYQPYRNASTRLQ
jgi:hypothetical protein